MEVIKKEKQFKEVIVEAYDLCDKCNQKITKGNFDAFDFELVLKTGSAYPEGGSGETDEVHLCSECAPELFGLLKKKGYRVNHSKWDW